MFPIFFAWARALPCIDLTLDVNNSEMARWVWLLVCLLLLLVVLTQVRTREY